MDKMRFKTFVWPENPTIYEEKLLRTPMYMKLEDGNIYFVGLGALKRTITGAGVFTGPEAYANYRALEALMEQTSPEKLIHPVWGERYCYLTGLELTQEPRENYVAYKFTFSGALQDSEIPQ